MKQAANLSALVCVQHGFYNANDSKDVVNPILMNQVHSADVLIVEKPFDVPPQVDALVTTKKGLNLTVKTADCAPVLLADGIHHVIGAVHAGWKGAFQGIIEATILKMLEQGAVLENIVAGVGPHIQKQSFEADDKMRALFPVTEHHFFTPIENGKYLFDFDAYVCHRLKRAGVQNIVSIQDDTYQDKNYLSFRREPENPARQYSVISLK